MTVHDPSEDQHFRQLGPLAVRAEARQQAIANIVNAVKLKRPMRVAFANTHLLYCAIQDRRLARDLSSFHILNDGVGLELLARFAVGRGFPDNLNGTDFVPCLLDVLAPGTKIYLLGARPDVAAAVAQLASTRWPQLDVCGWQDGYTNPVQALEDLERQHPDVVLVALGNPLQERWIARAPQGEAVFIGVGALFDFLSGAAERAPALWRRLHLEWLFRLAREPARLWRRYTVEVFVVVISILKTNMARARHD